MKPETEKKLAKARQLLDDGHKSMTVDLFDQAARLGYLVQYHSAQAAIFETTGKVAKTHKGVHRLFHKMALDHPQLDVTLAATLTSAYVFKELADYDTDRAPATKDDAEKSLANAEILLKRVVLLLSN